MSTKEKLRRQRQRQASKRKHGLRRILRIDAVVEITGKPKSSVYDEIAKGTFPEPIPLGERSVGWLEDEIAAWQEKQIATRDARA